MKLKRLCHAPFFYLIKNPICDSFTERIFVSYKELRDVIKSDDDLKNISLNQVSKISSQTIRYGIAEYRVDLHNGSSIGIYLSCPSEKDFTDVIPNALEYVFGKEIINEDFYANNQNISYYDYC